MELEFNEVIVQFIETIGIGNFILVVSVAALIVNLPTLISKLFSLFSSGKKEKETQETVGFIKTKLVDCSRDLDSMQKDVSDIANMSTNNIEKIKDLRNDLASVNNERREENMLLIDTMEDMLNSISSIKNIMKNVMSEEDAIKLISYLLGVFKSFSSSLLSKIMEALELSNEIEDELLNKKTLKSNIDSCWSDLKIEISRFNTPIKLKPLLDKQDKELWSKDGMFTQIIKLASSNSDSNIKKESIKKQIDISLRILFNNLADILEKNKS